MEPFKAKVNAINLTKLAKEAKDDEEMMSSFAYAAVHGKFPFKSKEARKHFLSLLASITLTVVYKEELDAERIKKYEEEF